MIKKIDVKYHYLNENMDKLKIKINEIIDVVNRLKSSDNGSSMKDCNNCEYIRGCDKSQKPNKRCKEYKQLYF